MFPTGRLYRIIVCRRSFAVTTTGSGPIIDGPGTPLTHTLLNIDISPGPVGLTYIFELLRNKAERNRRMTDSLAVPRVGNL